MNLHCKKSKNLGAKKVQGKGTWQKIKSLNETKRFNSKKATIRRVSRRLLYLGNGSIPASSPVRCGLVRGEVEKTEFPR